MSNGNGSLFHRMLDSNNRFVSAAVTTGLILVPAGLFSGVTIAGLASSSKMHDEQLDRYKEVEEKLTNSPAARDILEEFGYADRFELTGNSSIPPGSSAITRDPYDVLTFRLANGQSCNIAVRPSNRPGQEQLPELVVEKGVGFDAICR